MTTVVLDSKDLVTAVTTGEIPVPAEVAADNAARAAKEDKSKTADKPVDSQASTAKAAEKGKEPEKGTPADADADDVEGEDGLTPRQKRELTEKMQRAIGKKHRELKEAEEFAADQYNSRRLAEKRAETLERELAKLKGAEPAKEPDPEAGKPVRENFETDEAYREAIVDWKVDQRIKQQAAEDEKRREAERMQEVRRTAAERVTRAAELVPDYQEVVGSAEMEVPSYIASYMQESDLFAELGYHFATHPDVLERLAKLRPDRALVEVGKIESKLQPFKPVSEDAGEKASNGATPKQNGSKEPSTETREEPSRQSRAPVITPVTNSSASQVEKSPQEMNIRETITAWQKKKGVHLDRRKRH